MVRLATALRQPAEACGPLPPEADLARSLAESLPGLDAAHVAAAARTLRWGNVAGADPGSGVCLSCQPGASAYWLRGAGRCSSSPVAAPAPPCATGCGPGKARAKRTRPPEQGH
ncbi:hypothetical protein [Deinococcus radiodurans]|uniref:Uncharacterized protein n=1 Tax=Deinococcus radiodurans (strain ATCC 13939 / DSM 20539 / JCM 16871 / CCUG 27074 / LMG 4051 / NBRC 15346 / NCIMB 9279 / VKM B-1422 / R1) TaxID=243230 RepID=Q9RYL7_DEIRA|nr:hypothetical protein [Deinococcus radiodurans]AAF12519.1 hypothetical protein DR_A0295 [Deinococcus radiodurans R1 = ATCC 13939 = DSM 20539]